MGFPPIGDVAIAMDLSMNWRFIEFAQTTRMGLSANILRLDWSRDTGQKTVRGDFSTDPWPFACAGLENFACGTGGEA